MSDNKMSALSQLYEQKGRLMTKLEIMQRELQEVNQQIFQLMNAAVKQPKIEENN
ncbi:hypothetical protein LCGC14_0681260 [marine sediment metagenome]|uniref:Uncharacterized protein n=1 Tax=marine sediment metagenome TaxID=412755 RepID=A0A0F9T9G5_9ZZZZ